MVYKNHFYCRVYIFISKHPPNDTGQDRMNISVQHEFSRTVEKLLKNKWKNRWPQVSVGLTQ